MMTRKTRITLIQSRKALRRLDVWADSAAIMAHKGNMTMFTAYVDRINAVVSVLKDIDVMTAEEAEALLNEYADFWADTTGKELIRR